MSSYNDRGHRLLRKSAARSGRAQGSLPISPRSAWTASSARHPPSQRALDGAFFGAGLTTRLWTLDGSCRGRRVHRVDPGRRRLPQPTAGVRRGADTGTHVSHLDSALLGPYKGLAEPTCTGCVAPAQTLHSGGGGGRDWGHSAPQLPGLFPGLPGLPS